MVLDMNPKYKQALDDTFDAFTMLSGGHFVSLMHVEGGFTRYSPGAVELLGLPGEYIPNGAMDWADYLHPEDRKRYLDVMGPLANGERHTYDLTYRVRIKTGAYVSFRALGAVMRNDEGAPSLIGGLMINQDVMETMDAITILRNKYGFYDDMDALMKTNQKVVTLLLGFSGLSGINETRGYTFGNAVLQQVAWLIQETVGERGTIYRMDDATFAFVTTTLSEAETSALYDSIRLKLLRGVRVNGIRQNLSANGGLITTIGRQMEKESLYACLKYAYKESKERKHGELVDYNGSASYNADKSLEIISDIRDSVLEGCTGFSLTYQPVLDVSSGRPIGAEALIRWEGELYGEVFPDDFIPVIEQDFIYEELGSWIMEKAMEDGKRFLEKDPGFVVGINLSSSQLEDEYLLDSIEYSANRVGFPLKNLYVELTKGCRLLDIDRVKEITEQLREKGIGVVIDDFGSGFDSLGFLRKLSVDIVKFDISLMDGIVENKENQKTIRFLAEIAAMHGTTVCVKGVETREAHDILKGFSVDRVQGNYYSQPRSVAEVIDAYYKN